MVNVTLMHPRFNLVGFSGHGFAGVNQSEVIAVGLLAFLLIRF